MGASPGDRAQDARGSRWTTSGGDGPLTIRERRRMNPSRLCKAVITVAVHELPVEHRSRYALEFYSEMYGMTRARQLAYAGVVLTRAWSLAAALEGAHPEVEGKRPGRDWRCRLRRHRFVRRNNPYAETPEAAFYRQCVRCGLIDDLYRPPRRWGSVAPL